VPAARASEEEQVGLDELTLNRINHQAEGFEGGDADQDGRKSVADRNVCDQSLTSKF